MSKKAKSKKTKSKYPSDWFGGYSQGELRKASEVAVQARMMVNGKAMTKSFKYDEYPDAWQSAKDYLFQKTKEAGKLRNRMRYLDKNTLEVELTPPGSKEEARYMKIDVRYRNIINDYPITAKKKGGSGKYYVYYQNKKEVIPFYRRVSDVETASYANGDTFDLRECNLKEKSRKRVDVEQIREEVEQSLSENTETSDSDDEEIARILERELARGVVDVDDELAQMTPRETDRQKGGWLDPQRDCERRLTEFRKLKSLIDEAGYKMLSNPDDYKTAYSPMLVECNNGHKYTATKNNFVAGKRCPDCKTNINEHITVETISYLLDKPFEKIRPDWLKSKSGFNLELDGYNEELKLGVEYQGEQHYNFHKYFHRTKKNFEEYKKRDQEKLNLCGQQGVRLIEVPYTVPTEDIPKYLTEKLSVLGFNTKSRLKKIDMREIKRLVDKQEEYEELIAKQGGTLLEGKFESRDSKCTIQCDKGHKWETTFRSLKRGYWCDTCAYKRSGKTRSKISETLKNKFNTAEGRKKKQQAHAKRSETMAQNKVEARKKVQEEGKVCNMPGCPFPGQHQPAANFGKKEAQTDGLQTYCKKCQADDKRERKAKAKAQLAAQN